MTAEQWQEQAALEYKIALSHLMKGNYAYSAFYQRCAFYYAKQARIMMGVEEYF